MELNLNYIDSIKKNFLIEIIKDLNNLELPSEWKPKEVLGFVIRKLEEKENKC